MLSLSGFELYSRWVPLRVNQILHRVNDLYVHPKNSNSSSITVD